MVTSVWGWCIAIIIPGSPAPLPISSIFFAGGICVRIDSQSVISNRFISSSVKRPTMLWALLKVKISPTKALMSSFVVLFFVLIMPSQAVVFF